MLTRRRRVGSRRREIAIWGITAHLANYIDELTDALDGKPSPEFKTWPKIEDSDDWIALRDRVMRSCERLERQVEGLSAGELAFPAPGKQRPRSIHIVDIMVHDAYHAGQIVKLKQLYKSRMK
jgi:hypothetical protein